jgi:hypothetical protein
MGSDFDGKTATASRKVFCPAGLLPAMIPQGEIYTYGYNVDIIEEIFQASNSNNTSQHGNDLMVKIEKEKELTGYLGKAP